MAVFQTVLSCISDRSCTNSGTLRIEYLSLIRLIYPWQILEAQISKYRTGRFFRVISNLNFKIFRPWVPKSLLNHPEHGQMTSCFTQVSDGSLYLDRIKTVVNDTFFVTPLFEIDECRAHHPDQKVNTSAPALFKLHRSMIQVRKTHGEIK